MICNWIQYFGDYSFTTECGHTQGINIRPKQKTCYCGKTIERYVQDSNNTTYPVTRITVKNGNAYYSIF